MSDSDRYLKNVAPIAAVGPTGTAGNGVIRVAVTTAGARFNIPSWLAGKYAWFTAEGANIQLLCGAGSVVVVMDQAGSVAGEDITVHASSGATLRSYVPRKWLVPKADRATDIAVDADGSCNLAIELAE